MWQVDREDINGHPPDWSASNKRATQPHEVLLPFVAARVEQTDHIADVRVYARDVCALMVVASEARKSQVVRVIAATVLASDDVVDLEWEAIELLRQ